MDQREQKYRKPHKNMQKHRKACEKREKPGKTDRKTQKALTKMQAKGQNETCKSLRKTTKSKRQNNEK